MENFVVWDVDYNLEICISEQLGSPWFSSAEIKSGISYYEYVKKSNKKKIVLLHWFQYFSSITEDLSWADLIICFTTEVMHTNWAEYYQYSQDYFKNKNLIFIIGGKIKGDLISPPDLVFSPNLSFLTLVSRANDDFDYDVVSPRPFIFDALFGGKKLARINTFKKLAQLDLLDKSLVNLETGIYSNISESKFPDYRSSDLDLLEESIIKKFRDDANGDPNKLILSNGLNKSYKDLNNSSIWASQLIPVNIYKNSWFSIVSETFANDFEFVTEKTGKCFFGKRVFVCVASPGHLNLLHSQGFKTFNEIFDESYDHEHNLKKRIDMVAEQLVFLSKSDPVEIYRKAKPILDHNFNLINNMSWYMIKIKNFIEHHIEKLK